MSRVVAIITTGAIVGGVIGLLAGLLVGAGNPFYFAGIGMASGAAISLVPVFARKG